MVKTTVHFLQCMYLASITPYQAALQSKYLYKWRQYMNVSHVYYLARLISYQAALIFLQSTYLQMEI